MNWQNRWGGRVPPKHEVWLTLIDQGINSYDEIVDYTVRSVVANLPPEIVRVQDRRGRQYRTRLRGEVSELVVYAQEYVRGVFDDGWDRNRGIVDALYNFPLTCAYCVMGPHPIMVSGDYPQVIGIEYVREPWVSRQQILSRVASGFFEQLGVCQAHVTPSCIKCSKPFMLLKTDPRFIWDANQPVCGKCGEKLLMFVESTFKPPKKKALRTLPTTTEWNPTYVGPAPSPFDADPPPLSQPQPISRSGRAGRIPAGASVAGASRVQQLLDEQARVMARTLSQQMWGDPPSTPEQATPVPSNSTARRRAYRMRSDGSIEYVDN